MSRQPVALNAFATADSADALAAGGLPDTPFVGLRPFESTESVLFFGRREQTAELLQLLHRERFLAVVGSSGSGKSSLIRAGLIPKLKAGFIIGRSDRWHFIKMRPGNSPLANLAASLLSAFGQEPEPARIAEMVEAIRLRGARAVTTRLASFMKDEEANVFLLVDQFEEIFRFGAYDDEAEAEPAETPGDRDRRRDEAAEFVSIMLALAAQEALPVYVVMTMRSDFLGDCDAFYGLPQAMNRSQYLVPRLTRQQRLEAIESPINLYGGKIAPRLLDTVLNDMGEESDQLPVMQHAMLRTWEKWAVKREGPVDLEHYEHPEVGGIRNALSLDADSATAGMSDEELLVTRRMFQALTKTDARGRRLRRPAHLSEIQDITGADRETVLGIIKRFRGHNRSFLTVYEDKLTGDSLVDISHESLIRQWSTLGEWVREEVNSREQYVRLASDAALHFDSSGSKFGLWRDPALQLALDWWEERQPNNAWALRYHPMFTLAQDFLQRSARQRADEEAAAEAARVAKEQAEREEIERAQQLAEERQAQAEALAAARQGELEAAQKAAEQQRLLANERERTVRRVRTLAFVLIALLALALGAVVVAANSYRTANREKTRAENALGTAETERARAEDERARAEEEKTRATNIAAQLEGTLKEVTDQKKKVEEQKKKVEEQKLKADQSAQAAVEARQRAEAATLLAEQKQQEAESDRETAIIAQKVAYDAQQKAEATQAANKLYRDATRAVEEFNTDEARKMFDDAAVKYREVNDFDGEARAYDEAGTALLHQATAGAAGSGSYEEPQADAPSAAEFKSLAQNWPKVSNQFLGNEESPGYELYNKFGLTPETQEGFKYYGKAVNIYRQNSDFNGSARILNKASGSLYNENVVGPGMFPRDVWRTQVALRFACEAVDDYGKSSDGGSPEGQAAILMQMGDIITKWAVDPNGAMANPTDAAGATASTPESASKRPPLFGCKGEPASAVNYYEQAVPLFEKILERSRKKGGARQGSSAFNFNVSQVGQTLLSAGRTESARRLFEVLTQRQRMIMEQETDPVRARAARGVLLSTLTSIGEEHLESDDEKSAREKFDEALALSTDFDERAETLRIIRRASEGLSEEYYVREAQRYEAAGKRKEQGQLLRELGFGFSNSSGQGETQKSLKYLNQALSIFEELSDIKEQVETLSDIGRSYYEDSDAAIATYQKGLSLAVAAKEPELEGEMLGSLAYFYEAKGELQQAVAAYEKAIDAYKRAGSKNKNNLSGYENRLVGLKAQLAKPTPTPTPQ